MASGEPRDRDRSPHADIGAAGGFVFDDRGRLLLVQRRNPPGAGQWTIPGGKCEAGEAPAETCVREFAEETGLIVSVDRHVGQVHAPAPGGRRFVIDDFLCRVVSGKLTAGDDASDARWVGLAEFRRLPVVAGLSTAIEKWGLLPR